MTDKNGSCNKTFPAPLPDKSYERAEKALASLPKPPLGSSFGGISKKKTGDGHRGKSSTTPKGSKEHRLPLEKDEHEVH